MQSLSGSCSYIFQIQQCPALELRHIFYFRNNPLTFHTNQSRHHNLVAQLSQVYLSQLSSPLTMEMAERSLDFKSHVLAAGEFQQ